MNKFTSNLAQNSQSIRKERAATLSAEAQDASEEVERILSRELRNLKKELTSLSDVYPESEFSLMVTKEKFDAAVWAGKMQSLSVKIANKEVELKIAQKNVKDWFTDTTESDD